MESPAVSHLCQIHKDLFAILIAYTNYYYYYYYLLQLSFHSVAVVLTLTYLLTYSMVQSPS